MRINAILLAVVMAIAVHSAENVLAQTPMPLDECLALLGTPTDAIMNSKCDDKYNCPDLSRWYWGTCAAENARCTYQMTVTAVPAGVWVYEKKVTRTATSCQDPWPAAGCLGDSLKHAVSITMTESASTNSSHTYGVTAKKTLNLAWLGKIEVQGKYEYKHGTSSTSSEAKTYTDEGTISAPCCGKKDGHLCGFSRNRTGSGIVSVWLYSKCCEDSDSTCSPELVFGGRVSNDVSFTGIENTKDWRKCQVTCPTVHQCCDGSTTHDPNPVCNTRTPPAS